ncbi:MAG: hypothetical protein AABX83_00500 [Nanoarchaeota archaeon]|mgnify:FL=1
MSNLKRDPDYQALINGYRRQLSALAETELMLGLYNPHHTMNKDRAVNIFDNFLDNLERQSIKERELELLVK